MTAVLELNGISKAYGEDVALDALSLSLGQNEYMALLGPSGSGKSTLLRVIAGFEKPETGEVLLNGKPITNMPAHERGIGFVSQGFALFPHMTVFDNVAFGLRFREVNAVTNASEVERRVGDMLELVGLAELGDRAIGEISGGQKQRVALARTLVADPKVILLDEPLGALDANLRARMRGELRRIRKKLGISFMHVTGNEQEALAMGDRVAVLDTGRLAQISDPDTLFNRPASSRVARFLNCYNIFAGNERAAISGADSEATRDGEYCIRFDKIHVAPVSDVTDVGKASVIATYITSEYSGPSIMYFFKGADEKVLEVEYHLSHRKPEEFVAGAKYSLQWAVGDELIFDGSE